MTKRGARRRNTQGWGRADRNTLGGTSFTTYRTGSQNRGHINGAGGTYGNRRRI